MAKIDQRIHELCEKILSEGYKYQDESRETECLQISSYTFRHNLQTEGFPAMTTKQLYYKGVIAELIWFLKGETNIKYLVDNGVHIWDKDAYNYYVKKCKEQEIKYNSFAVFLDAIGDHSKVLGVTIFVPNDYTLGDLGPVYGAQWRNSGGRFSMDHQQMNGKPGIMIKGVDQIKNLIDRLRKNPMNRRHIVNAWNPSEMKDMALPPCHDYFQVVVVPLFRSEFTKKKMLGAGIPIYGFELHWHQRSVDSFLGLPFNIASYATLAMVIEKLTGYKALAIQGDLKNVHIYEPHIEAVKELLTRDVNKYSECEIEFDNFVDRMKENSKATSVGEVLDDLLVTDFRLCNYQSYPALKAEMLAPKN